MKLWCSYPPLQGGTRFDVTYISPNPAAPVPPGLKVEGFSVPYDSGGPGWTNIFPGQMRSDIGPPGKDLPPYVVVSLVIRKTGVVPHGTQMSGPVGLWTPGVGPEHIGHPFAVFVIDPPIVFNLDVPTCKASSPPPVDLGSIPMSRFSSVGVTSDERPFSIQLSCADGAFAGTAYATLTDQADVSNRSSTLSLSADSSATGVGIQILRNGSVLKYGPDDMRAGNENQWLAATNVGNGIVNIPLTARYVRTAQTMTAGTARGRATFTMSYY